MEILTFPENCVGCLLCQMRCSLEYTDAINPLKARLVITRPVTGKRGISLTDECNSCGLCARVCLYNAIQLKEKGD